MIPHLRISLSSNCFGFAVSFFAYLIANYMQLYDVQTIIDIAMVIVLIFVGHWCEVMEWCVCSRGPSRNSAEDQMDLRQFPTTRCPVNAFPLFEALLSFRQRDISRWAQGWRAWSTQYKMWLTEQTKGGGTIVWDCTCIVRLGFSRRGIFSDSIPFPRLPGRSLHPSEPE
jgi:hypothetical protein